MKQAHGTSLILKENENGFLDYEHGVIQKFAVGSSRVYQADCMDLLRQTPDKYYSLCIVDPPYGMGIGQRVGGGKAFGKDRGRSIIAPKIYRGFDDSQIPGAGYFQELKRVSANQIIFGGNYFIQHLENTPCFVVWDKDRTGNFADAELAWTSFKSPTKIFRFRWNGLLQQDMKNKEERIHPTHKPVALYRWLLKNYAKPGDKILDTHLGSGSSRIAAHEAGHDFVGFELDKDYFEAQEKRFQKYLSQQVLEFV